MSVYENYLKERQTALGIGELPDNVILCRTDLEITAYLLAAAIVTNQDKVFYCIIKDPEYDVIRIADTVMPILDHYGFKIKKAAATRGDICNNNIITYVAGPVDFMLDSLRKEKNLIVMDFRSVL